MSKIDSLLVHIRTGRHQGVPDCCIEWYLDYWLKFWTHSTFGAGYRKLFKSLGWEYVPCPSCLADKPAGRLNKCRHPVGRPRKIKPEETRGQ